jgi:hypothetical protein
MMNRQTECRRHSDSMVKNHGCQVVTSSCFRSGRGGRNTRISIAITEVANLYMHGIFSLDYVYERRR